MPATLNQFTPVQELVEWEHCSLADPAMLCIQALLARILFEVMPGKSEPVFFLINRRRNRPHDVGIFLLVFLLLIAGFVIRPKAPCA